MFCARLHMAPRFVRSCTGLQDEKAEVRCCGVRCVHAFMTDDLFHFVFICLFFPGGKEERSRVGRGGRCRIGNGDRPCIQARMNAADGAFATPAHRRHPGPGPRLHPACALRQRRRAHHGE